MNLKTTKRAGPKTCDCVRRRRATFGQAFSVNFALLAIEGFWAELSFLGKQIGIYES
jgi:hypothetical protein